MADQEHQKQGFPFWAGPGLGALIGAFVAFCTLLQNEPLSPWPPLQTITLGVATGVIAGVLLALREYMRHR